MRGHFLRTFGGLGFWCDCPDVGGTLLPPTVEIAVVLNKSCVSRDTVTVDGVWDRDKGR